MSPSRRLGQWLGRLAIVMQIAMAGLPLVDAALFHGSRAAQASHVEAAGVSCHAEDCVLGQTLQSPGEAFPEVSIASLLGDVLLDTPRPLSRPPVHRTVGIPVGPRAPPPLG